MKIRRRIAFGSMFPLLDTKSPVLVKQHTNYTWGIELYRGALGRLLEPDLDWLRDRLAHAQVTALYPGPDYFLIGVDVGHAGGGS